MRVNDAHKGKVSGVCFSDEHRLLSCGVDRNVKLWDTREVDENGAGPSEVYATTFRPSLLYLRAVQSRKPLSIFPGKTAFK